MTTPRTALLLLALLAACEKAPSRADLAEDGKALLSSLAGVVDTLKESHTADSVRAGVDSLVTDLTALKQRAAASSRALLDDPDLNAAMDRTRQALESVEARLRGVVEDEQLRAALQQAADRLRAQLAG